jgi:hypothetical protein
MFSRRVALTLSVLAAVPALAACDGNSPTPVPAPTASATSSESAAATAATPTSRPPTFTEAGWFGTHPIQMDDSIQKNVFAMRAIIVTGTTGPDWGNRQYTGGLNQGWFLAYHRPAVSAGRVRPAASDCTVPVQGHADYCVGSEALYGIHLYLSTPLSEGIYQATKVMLFDENTSQIDTDNGTVPAGQKFRAILDSPMLDFDRNTFRAGDIAAIWLDDTTRGDNIDGFKELPTDAFIPVTS